MAQHGTVGHAAQLWDLHKNQLQLEQPFLLFSKSVAASLGQDGRQYLANQVSARLRLPVDFIDHRTNPNIVYLGHRGTLAEHANAMISIQLPTPHIQPVPQKRAWQSDADYDRFSTKPELSVDRYGGDDTLVAVSKTGERKLKKAKNQHLVFRELVRGFLKEVNPDVTFNEISTDASIWWARMTDEEKLPFKDVADSLATERKALLSHRATDANGQAQMAPLNTSEEEYDERVQPNKKQKISHAPDGVSARARSMVLNVMPYPMQQFDHNTGTTSETPITPEDLAMNQGPGLHYEGTADGDKTWAIPNMKGPAHGTQAFPGVQEFPISTTYKRPLQIAPVSDSPVLQLGTPSEENRFDLTLFRSPFRGQGVEPDISGGSTRNEGNLAMAPSERQVIINDMTDTHESFESAYDILRENPTGQVDENDQGRVKKSKNQHLIFRELVRGFLTAVNPGVSFNEISMDASIWWEHLSVEDRKPFKDMADGLAIQRKIIVEQQAHSTESRAQVNVRKAIEDGRMGSAKRRKMSHGQGVVTAETNPMVRPYPAQSSNLSKGIATAGSNYHHATMDAERSMSIAAFPVRAPGLAFTTQKDGFQLKMPTTAHSELIPARTPDLITTGHSHLLPYSVHSGGENIDGIQQPDDHFMPYPAQGACSSFSVHESLPSNIGNRYVDYAPTHESPAKLMSGSSFEPSLLLNDGSPNENTTKSHAPEPDHVSHLDNNVFTYHEPHSFDWTELDEAQAATSGGPEMHESFSSAYDMIAEARIYPVPDPKISMPQAVGEDVTEDESTYR
ncbi:hypothetical protein F5Y18DRAFT_428102 [Xylariaceae sp. FL1019]|nr:hypothetical protein F5Y18DRAFT_428102 [Xylariaceae sp. FL1019]